MSRSYLACPIHCIAAPELDRRSSREKIVRAVRKQSGLGRDELPVDSTITIPAKERGRFHTQLQVKEDRLVELKARELTLDGRPLPPQPKSRAKRDLFFFVDTPPKLLLR